MRMPALSKQGKNQPAVSYHAQVFLEYEVTAQIPTVTKYIVP